MARRLFVAVPLSDTVQEELRTLVDALRPAARGIRWVRPESMHVTLKFLGDVEEEREATLRDALRSVRGHPFRLRLSGVGAFPDRRRPRVFWTGIGEGRAEVAALAAAVDARLEAAGFAREARPFSPHVTLGRVKSPGNLEALWEIADRLAFRASRVEVRALRLIHSQLLPRGPVYTEVESFALRDVEQES